MAGFDGLFNHDNEQIHKYLYGLHWDVYNGALGKIKTALMVLHKIEAHQDLRSRAREYIGLFENLRSDLEGIGRHAGDLRSLLMKENGCDGSCSGAAESTGGEGS